MRYTIDPVNFAIHIFEDGADVPFQFQPNYPNTDPFNSVEEATAWAEASIAAFDPIVQTYAPNGKNLAPELKNEYKPETISKATEKAAVLARLGLTAEQATLLLS